MTNMTTQPPRKRRNCSYNIEEVQEECYLLSEAAGEMYFCSTRCLFLWAAMFATKANRTEEQKVRALEMKTPEGERRMFADPLELAQWAAAHVLQGDDNPWIKNGTKLTS